MNITKNVLLDLLNEIKLYQNKFKQTNVMIEKKNLNNDDMKVIPDFSSYPTLIQKKILSMKKIIHTHKFKTNIHSFTIYIISESEHIDTIQNIVLLMYTWLNIVEKKRNEKCSENISIYLTLTDSLKLLPSIPNKILDREHINTAFTYSCKKYNHIHIYRKEEWFKVFIHETFHCFGLDFSHTDSNITNKFASQIYHLNTDFRIYESYCETWATIINCLFISSLQYKRNTMIIKNTFELLKKEIQHSLFQCNKLLNYYNTKYKDFYESDNNSQFNRIMKYKENTPCISYYFFKTALLYHYNTFITWCHDNNENVLNFNNEKNIYNKIENYCLLINSLSKNNTYTKDIEDSYVVVKEMMKQMKVNNIFQLRTLRMTINDIPN